MGDGPNFLYLGAPKAGSTWLFNLLRVHPLAFAPAAKDLYFFDRNYHRGFAWYLSHFRAVHKQHLAIGEFSHDYLYSAVAAKRIRNFRRDIKLIAILRNPLDRAISEIGFLARNGENIDDPDRLIDHYPEIIEKGLYASHLARYDHIFKPNRVHVLFYDDLLTDPEAFAASVFEILDLPCLSRPQTGARANAAAAPRARLLALGAKRLAVWIRALGGAGVVGRLKTASMVRGILYKPGGVDLSRHRAFVAENFGDLFLNDISGLERRLGRSLSHWAASFSAPREPCVMMDESEK